MSGEPMIPLLTGWLLGAVARDGDKIMRIDSVAIDPPNCFTVKFASGLELEVMVSKKEQS